ncbi:MAG: hypothetical protein HY890_00845 [Deltaproteobacteria bacterium]|nr:hypothetical protein [Deltaproteobacteria bacterium]
MKTRAVRLKDINRKAAISTAFFLFLISLFVASGYAVFSHAGEYHASSNKTVYNVLSGTETLACAQCHTMHGSQGGQSLVYDSSQPQPKLLRATSVTNLCLYCHGENNPGVADSAGRVPPQIANNQMGYIPSAGDFKDRGSQNEANRHSVGANVSSTPPPGYSGTWSDVTFRYSTTFNCEYCHDQHGNTNYRNLRYNPGEPLSDSPTSSNRVDITYAYSPTVDPNDNTKDVNYWGAGANTAPENKFTRKRVRFRRSPMDNDSPKRGIAAFCAKCHVNFNGASGSSNMGGVASGSALGAGDNNTSSYNPWVRHPESDITIDLANTNKHADLANWGGLAATSRTRHIDPDGTPGNGDDQPFCLTCHYAHGGGNPNKDTTPEVDHTNLVFFDAAGKVNIEKVSNSGSDYDPATGRIRNLCEQCHNQ